MEREGELYHTEVVVDGWKILITHPGPDVAWEIGVELTKLIAEPGAGLATVGGDESKAAAALPLAVKALMSRIDAKTSLILVKKILRCCEIQGHEDGTNKKVFLDDVGFKTFFQGKMGTMLKLLGVTVEFTHADFFGAMKDGIRTMMTKALEEIAA